MIEIHKDRIKQIEAFLSKYPGGSIILTKDSPQTNIASLVISNPLKKNAISGTMMIQFRNCIKELKKWKNGKAVLIYGHGNIFSSGADLAISKNSIKSDEGLMMSEWMQNSLIRLVKLPIVSVAMLKGPTIGGAAEIALHCDYIIVCEDAKFGLVHSKMGITTPWGGTTRLIQKIGTKGLDLLLSGAIMSASELYNIGIADLIIDSQKPMRVLLRFLRPRLHAHTSVIRGYKKIVNSSIDFRSLELEKRIFAPTWAGKEKVKALKKQIKHC